MNRDPAEAQDRSVRTSAQLMIPVGDVVEGLP